MKIIKNITKQNYQQHKIVYNNQTLLLRLRFFEVGQFWTFDAIFNDNISVYGKRLVLGPKYLDHRFPFSFSIVDTSGVGIDPFKIDDFSEGRCVIAIPEDGDI